MMELLRYQREDGREPFTEWLSALRDKVAQARIRVRLRQVQSGNFGDSEPVGEGVFELRIHIGAGLSRLLQSARSICGALAVRRQ
jgi:putative addiction module killer protein